MQQVLGDLRRLAGEPAHQIGADAAFGQHAGAIGRDAQQVARPEGVDPLEGVEDRRDQHRPSIVGFDVGGVVGRARRQRLPAPLGVDRPDHVAQRAAVPFQRLAELRRQLAENEPLPIQAPGGGVQPVLDQFAKREALEQRHDVGEALMERRHVGVGVLDVARMNRVENRVRRLVGDDVRAQAGEDEPARIVGALELIGGGEVAEQEGDLVGIVIGVGVAQRVRMDAEPLDVVVAPLPGAAVRRRRRPHQARPPHHPPSQRAFEVADRLHRHGVDELLVKLRVAFAGRQALLRGDLLARQVHRLVPAAARRIEVDDFDVFTDRSRIHGFEGHAIEDFVDAGRLEPGGKAGIERVAAKIPVDGRLHRPPTLQGVAIIARAAQPSGRAGGVSKRTLSCNRYHQART